MNFHHRHPLEGCHLIVSLFTINLGVQLIPRLRHLQRLQAAVPIQWELHINKNRYDGWRAAFLAGGEGSLGRCASRSLHRAGASGSWRLGARQLGKQGSSDARRHRLADATVDGRAWTSNERQIKIKMRNRHSFFTRRRLSNTVEFTSRDRRSQFKPCRCCQDFLSHPPSSNPHGCF